MQTEKRKSSEKQMISGFLFALSGGFLWGLSGTCGQYLFTFEDLISEWLTVTRMLFSGIILLGVSAISHREEMTAVWKNKKDAIRLVLFAILGLTNCQYMYLTAIAYSNAGTATVLQYLGPALIMIISCVMGRRLPSKKELGAILLAITVIVGFGMMIAGILLFFVFGYWNYKIAFHLPLVLGVGAIVLIGTALAFTLYLQGVSDIGSVKASMIACVEPVSATIISALWLKTKFTGIDIVGLIAILTAVLLLSKKDNSRVKTLSVE